MFILRPGIHKRKESWGSSLFFNKLCIQICQRCFWCHSIALCPTCDKCQKCCVKSACRGQTSKLLADLAGPGCRSESGSNPPRGLHPPLPDPTKTHKNSHSHKLLCQSLQEQLPVRGIASAYRQKCCITGVQPGLVGVLQPTLFSPKTQQQVEADIGPKQSESISQGGDTGNHQDLPTTSGMGYLDRLQGCLLPYTDTGTVQEISEISCPGADIPIQSTALWSIHSTLGVHCDNERGETDGDPPGYKDPPVPRRLVGESQIPPSLSSTYPVVSDNVSETRLAGEYRKVGAGAQTRLRFCRLPVRPQVRPDPTDTGPVAKPSRENSGTVISTGLSGPAVHVLDRFVNSHGEASPPGSFAYEAYTVAPQKQLESTGITREGHSDTQVTAPSSQMVAGGKQCASRSTITPLKTCATNLYRCIKRRVGCSLKRTHCKRVLVSARKQVAHKPSGTKSSFSSSKRVPRPLCRQHSPSDHRQYDSRGLHKQRGRHEIGPTLCASMENLDLVFQFPSDSKSPTHTGPSKCDSRQVIQAGSDHPDRMVPPPRSLSKVVQQMAPASDRSVCHEVQPQVTSICFSSTGPPGSSSGCTHSAMGGSGCICIPTDRHIGQSGGEVTRFPVQETHPDCSGVAQHALVLGFGDHVQSDPSQPAQSAQSVDTALQSDPSQKSDKSKSPCMAPRASAIKEQGFSEAVAARIEAPQRRSTRSVYEAKWTIFTKWCITNQVDFRSPPVKSVADFLLYLFEDKKLQPSTIDGYKSAIADKLGNATINISKDDNLTRLLESFHRDRPKGRRGIPSWNLSLVLHQLTKAPFETP